MFLEMHMNSVGETMNSNPKYQHMGINDVSEVKTVFSSSFYQMLFDDPCKSLLHFQATTVLLHISLSSAKAGLSLELCLNVYWVIIFNQREMEN
jgi:hypothetical protein